MAPREAIFARLSRALALTRRAAPLLAVAEGVGEVPRSFLTRVRSDPSVLDSMPIAYEQTTAHTSDGFALALYRSRAHARPLRPRPPVLLIPGFSSNRFTFGVRQGDSLPAMLNAAGRDVWLCELRGSRSSRWLGRGKPIVDVDAKLHFDMPAILDQVRRQTDADAVDIVGHSLGGLLALLAAGGDDLPTASAIGRIVTLATPGTFKGIVGAFEAAGPVFRGLARGVEELAGRFASGFALAPLARTPGPLPHLFALSRHFLPGAVDVAIRRLYLDHAIESVHGGELAQLTRWVREGHITDREGRTLEDRFARVDVPVLVMTATRDRVAPEANTYAAYAKIASDDKEFRVIGRRHGARRDYAHADLLLADSAVEDVHEPIIDWLEARADASRQRASGTVSTHANERRPTKSSGSRAPTEVRRTPGSASSAR